MEIRPLTFKEKIHANDNIHNKLSEIDEIAKKSFIAEHYKIFTVKVDQLHAAAGIILEAELAKEMAKKEKEGETV